ncbi:hypothetical protein GCM10010919_25710 [Alishewanella longhuensis]|uniref:DUF4262 domain-containing protein n=1 Tax=Alishewanella longhuensis TaxID=1091037 RepID=A0ABQ3L0Z6_9ALTE|nr:DUF4262 domain-containing protein [Alishewanella longhuensis]GHG73134.1 hypothetical protein GCM10010919_25710 [Alishewanella longhuensis]
MNKAEIEITDNIKKHGCHVTSVFDRKGEEPRFTYTIGVYQEENQPELIIVGLNHELGAWIANEYNRRIQSDEIFQEGNYYSGFLDGFEVCFRVVAEKYKREFMLSCNWLYKDTNYPALQLIYPSVNGVWPWHKDASENFKSLQPSFQDISAW